jgi:hypothetical protein
LPHPTTAALSTLLTTALAILALAHRRMSVKEPRQAVARGARGTKAAQ